MHFLKDRIYHYSSKVVYGLGMKESTLFAFFRPEVEVKQF